MLAQVLRLLRSTPFRVVFVVAAVGLAVWAIWSDRDQIGVAVGRLSATALGLAAAASVANVLVTCLIWRSVLRDMGSPMPLRAACQVFLIGQLGKYLPGGVLQVVAAAELGSEHQVPRARTAAAMVVTILLSIVTGGLIVAASLPFVEVAAGSGLEWAAAAVPVLLVLLHPRVSSWALGHLLRVLGRAPVDITRSLRGTVAAGGWAALAWVAAGVQVLALSVGLGAEPTPSLLLLVTAGYAAAWVVGFAVIVVPAGLGVREVVLAAVLVNELGTAEVLVVVIASRALFTVADIALAGVALAVRGRTRQVRRGTGPRPGSR